MSIKEQLERDMQEYGTNNTKDFFRFEEGESRIRILTNGAVLPQHFFGKGKAPSVCYGEKKGCPFHNTGDEKTDKVSIKYSIYIIDRKDNKLKLADIPYSVMAKISDLQEDVDYKFADFPMPYDIKVIYKPDEAPANKYAIIAGRANTPVEPEILKELAEIMKENSPEQIVQRKKDKQIKEHKEQGTWIDPEVAETKRVEQYRKDVAEFEAKNPVATIQIEEKKEDITVSFEKDSKGNEIKPEDIPW